MLPSAGGTSVKLDLQPEQELGEKYRKRVGFERWVTNIPESWAYMNKHA